MSARHHPQGAPLSPTARLWAFRDDAEPGDAAFDYWLRDEFSRRYDATLLEPVPEDLQKLLDLSAGERGEV